MRLCTGIQTRVRIGFLPFSLYVHVLPGGVCVRACSCAHPSPCGLPSHTCPPRRSRWLRCLPTPSASCRRRSWRSIAKTWSGGNWASVVRQTNTPPYAAVPKYSMVPETYVAHAHTRTHLYSKSALQKITIKPKIYIYNCTSQQLCWSKLST